MKSKWKLKNTLDTHDNENTTIQNPLMQQNQFLGGKSIAIQAFIEQENLK